MLQIRLALVVFPFRELGQKSWEGGQGRQQGILRGFSVSGSSHVRTAEEGQREAGQRGRGPCHSAREEHFRGCRDLMESPSAGCEGPATNVSDAGLWVSYGLRVSERTEVGPCFNLQLG